MTILLIVTFVAIFLSVLADFKKTLAGIKKGFKMFLNLLPSLISILIFVSIFLYFVPADTLTRWLGKNSGLAGLAVAAGLGSISLIPGFIAYPLAAVMIKSGVGYNIIAVFITTLMMVGILTLPLEARYFGMRVAIIRNSLSFIGAIIIGFLVGLFL